MSTPRKDLDAELGRAIEVMAATLQSHEKAEADPALGESLGLRALDWPAYQAHLLDLRGHLYEARRARYARQQELGALAPESAHAA